MSNFFYVVCIIAIVFAADTYQKYLKAEGKKAEKHPALDESLEKIKRLEERIQVLERIVTENKFDLGREIDGLK